MKPAARYAAAIDILDRIIDGAPAEQCLTNWARGNRFAGSKDRAAIRDIVFDCLRCKRSFAHAGGAQSGRGLIIGQCLNAGLDPDSVFSGEGYAPPPLSDAERMAMGQGDATPAVLLDCPDWLEMRLRDELGVHFEPVMHAQQARAPVDLRVNTLKATRKDAQDALATEGVETEAVDGIETALRVKGMARGLRNTSVFQSGIVELQDAGAQALVLALSGSPLRILDLCAGGGGKSLALAARFPDARIAAFDAHARRLAPLTERADRSGAKITMLSAPPTDAAFDLVVADVPCSGSGTWSRGPDAKWRFGPEDLEKLLTVQSEILDQSASLVPIGGHIAYMTCSLLNAENQEQVAGFLDRNTAFEMVQELRLLPCEGTDGFYLAEIRRKQ